MYFQISSELLNEENEIALGDFAKRFFQDRIFVEFTDIEIAQQWIESLERKQKERWSRLIKQSVSLKSKHNVRKSYLTENRVKVLPGLADSKWDTEVELTLADAVMVLDHSIMIGLENSRTDQAFLLTLLPLKSRMRFLDLVDKGRLEFVGSGGNGELKVQLMDRVKRKSFRLLSWVMFDNDAKFPGDVSPATADLIAVCEAHNLNFHCLTRRCVENYISRAIYDLAHPDDRGAKVKAIFSLSEEQLKYFNLKNGFGSTRESDYELYSTLTKPQKIALKDGFGSKIAPEVYGNVDIRDEVHEILKKTGIMNEFGDKIRHLEQLLGRPV